MLKREQASGLTSPSFDYCLRNPVTVHSTALTVQRFHRDLSFALKSILLKCIWGNIRAKRAGGPVPEAGMLCGTDVRKKCRRERGSLFQHGKWSEALSGRLKQLEILYTCVGCLIKNQLYLWKCMELPRIAFKGCWYQMRQKRRLLYHAELTAV